MHDVDVITIYMVDIDDQFWYLCRVTIFVDGGLEENWGGMTLWSLLGWQTETWQMYWTAFDRGVYLRSSPLLKVG